MGATGTVSSFNWQGTSSRTSSVHLQNQNYFACVRQESGKCVICWSPATTGNRAITTGSFGLSVSSAAITSNGDDGARCTTDFVTIVNGHATAAIAGSASVSLSGTDKICGRFFSTAAIATTANSDASVCSRATPFALGVVTNGNEQLTGGAVNADTNEFSDGTGTATMAAAPFGTQGFSLGYTQSDC